jgi:hypothetical protein
MIECIPAYEQNQSSFFVWKAQLHQVHSMLDPLMRLRLSSPAHLPFKFENKQASYIKKVDTISHKW